MMTSMSCPLRQSNPYWGITKCGKETLGVSRDNIVSLTSLSRKYYYLNYKEIAIFADNLFFILGVLMMLEEIFKDVLQQVNLRLVYIVSYDLNNAQNEYSEINKSLEKAGYSRDSNLGEKTIPKNLFAGEKDKLISPNLKESDFIKSESLKFKNEVIEIINKEAPDKLDKLFVSVSKKDVTTIRLV
ncbi:hypothetical protein [Enterobacter asburiae]|jgi:hypothetical protein|uniref:hypothetical protein n=1 Tax=Enterobacter asburiae TaxID=61645 RepID=UPI001C5BEE03|nr:hypothetical protein [Enterobacter asburiae]ELH8606634.1 hypothetical protein [Enterobacter asburiae]MBW4211780.1 hypothetical protein [Enterobacter asburiae]